MRPMKPRQPGSAYEALEHAVEEIGRKAGTDAWGGNKIAADFLGIKPTTFNHLLDPDHVTGELSFVRVAQLSDHFQLQAPVRFLADLVGCKVVTVPRTGIADTEVSALLHIAKESTEVLSTGWTVLADGKLDEVERREWRRQIGEAVEALLELDARLEGAEQ